MNRRRQNWLLIACALFVASPIVLAFCGGTPDPQPTTTTTIER